MGMCWRVMLLRVVGAAVGRCVVVPVPLCCRIGLVVDTPEALCYTQSVIGIKVKSQMSGEQNVPGLDAQPGR